MGREPHMEVEELLIQRVLTALSVGHSTVSVVRIPRCRFARVRQFSFALVTVELLPLRYFALPYSFCNKFCRWAPSHYGFDNVLHISFVLYGMCFVKFSYPC